MNDDNNRLAMDILHNAQHGARNSQDMIHKPALVDVPADDMATNIDIFELVTRPEFISMYNRIRAELPSYRYYACRAKRGVGRRCYRVWHWPQHNPDGRAPSGRYTHKLALDLLSSPKR